ncbi:hypothetical protein [Streptomyces sp. NPDC005423]|uniref:hypothetical protein n=1 Tax=Streptomyces sp. NPDC005423 TaxID=3155343 RepID=UPI0033A82E24
MRHEARPGPPRRITTRLELAAGLRRAVLPEHRTPPGPLARATRGIPAGPRPPR